MASALIGHTGFVGGNLVRQRAFDEFYNSKNIETIAGRSFDLVVCSGAPAEKWKANKDPDSDKHCLDRLWSSLRQATASKLILISTVDVYARPIDVYESDDVGADQATAYGRHRHELERRVADHFDALIVRLPGLFGDGLRKNVIYDFLHDNNVDQVDSRSAYQFYWLGHLWRDIYTAIAAGLAVVNIATEPIAVGEVAREAFGFEFANALSRPPALYDFRSLHDRLYGGSSGYLYTKAQVLDDMRRYVSSQPRASRCA